MLTTNIYLQKYKDFIRKHEEAKRDIEIKQRKEKLKKIKKLMKYE